MNKLLRILKHRWFDQSDTRRALGPAVVQRLQQRVAASERRHSGEIRVCVEAGLPLSYLWRGLGARDRAVTMFGKLRVWDTEFNNGVLIYLLLAEHAIEIVADRGLNAQVSSAQWSQIVATMREAFRAGRHEQGLGAAIDAVDALLRQHFALAPG
ncbi:MAG TPA: TPM domain-containing protein, partial [Burkholderiaceae bacterium]